jgi:hypothetical protein
MTPSSTLRSSGEIFYEDHYTNGRNGQTHAPTHTYHSKTTDPDRGKTNGSTNRRGHHKGVR